MLNEGQLQLQSFLDDAGLHYKFRTQTPGMWAKIAGDVAYFPVMYSDSMIDWRILYLNGTDRAAFDTSLILYHDNRPCAIWPLTLESNERWKISSNGDPVLPPLFSTKLSPRTVKTLAGECLNLIDRVAKANSHATWESIQIFTAEFCLSEWHVRSMWKGASAEIRYEAFVDLSLDIATIKSYFRKSYRPLLSVGQRLWSVGTLDSDNPAIWSQFRELHGEAAGRVTRSAESWELQHDTIKNGSAFLVYLCDTSGKMVGGALFDCTKHEAFYSVAAYDRRLFDKPLGHAVIYRGIEVMKSRGIRWFRIGVRSYPSDVPAPSDKNIAIGEFIEGFATHMFPTYLLKHTTP